MASKYTVLDFAADVLKTVPKPLTYQELWDVGKGLPFAAKLSLSGKTPWQTLGARLFVDTRDNPRSLFMKVAKNPARFWLVQRGAELTPADLQSVPLAKAPPNQKAAPSYHERELHPLVAYFAYANTSFNRGRQIYTKTIRHEKTTGKSFSEWLHPDMVGFYMPIEDWNGKLLALNKVTATNAVSLYAFEIKKRIDRSTYREYFFQAVSNSSWANEGYLVACSIQQQDDLLAELERLSASFGIGIIELDLDDLDSSRVLFPAIHRPTLDWETMNKLCEQNSDFEAFIDDVQRDYAGNKIHPSEYDNVIEDPEAHVKKLLSISNLDASLLVTETIEKRR